MSPVRAVDTGEHHKRAADTGRVQKEGCRRVRPGNTGLYGATLGPTGVEAGSGGLLESAGELGVAA